jgi:hypothetical protein
MAKPELQRSVGYLVSQASVAPPLKLNVNANYYDNYYDNYYKKYSSNVNKRPSVQLTQPVYFISGHGGEILYNKFVVPDHCQIVASNKAGILIENSDFLTKSRALCKLRMIDLENPSKASSKIINKIGAVSIFKPGNICPNFIYELYDNIINVEEGPMLNNRNWGIIPFINFCKILSIQNDKNELISDIVESFNNVNDIVNYIAKRYEYSEYPTEYQIKVYLTNILLPSLKIKIDDHFINLADKSDKSDKFILILNTLVSLPNTPIIIEQKLLCKHIGGCFYNLACRGNKATLKQNNDPNSNFVNITNNINSISSIKNKYILNTLKQRIGETLQQRKPYIRNMFNRQDKKNNNATYVKNSNDRWHIKKGGLNKYKKYRKTHKRKRT